MTQGAGELRQFAITTVSVRYEHDVVLARQRARQIAAQLGFDIQEQVRFATALSELVRNAYQYAGGGRVAFTVQQHADANYVVAQVSDKGSGIANVEQILNGGYQSRTGMGLGVIGARRLSDRFAIETAATGTRVTIGKVIPAPTTVSAASVAAIGAALSNAEANSPYEEVQRQNQELLSALELLRESKANIDRLNQELEETNRGVVALYAELDERANEMKRLSETKTRFLSDMSHELRTPLSSIINLSRLLLSGADGPLGGEHAQQVTLVQKSAEWLVEMVSDLLDIAKIEAGRVDLRVDTFPVSALFATLRGMFRSPGTNEQVALVFEEDTTITLVSDEQRVAQVLRNFISNALKFTLAGEIRVGASADGDDVRLFVSDTGTGIAPEDRDRIFEDFEQVDGPIQRRLRGTGLGLPLTRKLAKLLGGHVSLESVSGVGSTFSLTIPRVLSAGGTDG